MTLEELTAVVDALLAELRDAGISNPLAESFTLSAILVDLYRLADLPIPLPLVLALDRATGTPVPAA